MTLQTELTPDSWLTDVLALLERVQNLKCCCTQPECRGCIATRLLAYYHQQMEPYDPLILINRQPTTPAPGSEV